MTPTQLFTLAPARTLSAGGPGDALAVPVHSDTLAAALRCVALETGVLAAAFTGAAPPFCVSSVFPEAEGSRLYPRPLRPPFLRGEGQPLAAERRSTWEGLRFVTEARLESLAEGRRVRFEAEDVVEGQVWGMPSERSLRGLPSMCRESGLVVDRLGNGVERFGRGRAAFPAGGRLFFLARLEDPALLPPLKELVARLGEAGLGGRRSIGAGQFELAGVHAAPAFLAEKGNGSGPLLLLSLYLPSREEAARGVLEGAAADLVSRGGWIHSGGPTRFRKRPVRMLAEGTVIAEPRGPLSGEVRDVAPPGFDRHPVWRDGRPLAISYREGP